LKLLTSLFFALAALTSGAQAQPASLKPELSGLSFLTGDWSSGRGKIADTGGSSTGSSSIKPEANGAVLLRRDHTNLFDPSGKPTGGFDQVMMIYAEDGVLRADYSDGSRVIHYTSAVVQPGRSVTFMSAAHAGAPIFRLAYALSDPSTLTIAFSMATPGSSDFRPIATGSLKKVD
jgi:hypothetical protein